MTRTDELRENYRRLPDVRLETLAHEAHQLDDDALAVLAEEIGRRDLVVATHFVPPEVYDGAVREAKRSRRHAAVGIALAAALTYGFVAVGRMWQEGAEINLLDRHLWGFLATAVLVYWALFLVIGYGSAGLRRGFRALRSRISHLLASRRAG